MLCCCGSVEQDKPLLSGGGGRSYSDAPGGAADVTLTLDNLGCGDAWACIPGLCACVLFSIWLLGLGRSWACRGGVCSSAAAHAGGGPKMCLRPVALPPPPTPVSAQLLR
jgi:hypothetical protein